MCTASSKGMWKVRGWHLGEGRGSRSHRGQSYVRVSEHSRWTGEPGRGHCLPDLHSAGPHGGNRPWGLGVRDKERGVNHELVAECCGKEAVLQDKEALFNNTH